MSNVGWFIQKYAEELERFGVPKDQIPIFMAKLHEYDHRTTHVHNLAKSHAEEYHSRQGNSQ